MPSLSSGGIFLSASLATVFVRQPHDIVFAEVGPALNLDQVQRLVIRIR
jgi:hypothetical protein